MMDRCCSVGSQTHRQTGSRTAFCPLVERCVVKQGVRGVWWVEPGAPGGFTSPVPATELVAQGDLGWIKWIVGTMEKTTGAR